MSNVEGRTHSPAGSLHDATDAVCVTSTLPLELRKLKWKFGLFHLGLNACNTAKQNTCNLLCTNKSANA
jgi:hypothetical protein